MLLNTFDIRSKEKTLIYKSGEPLALDFKDTPVNRSDPYQLTRRIFPSLRFTWAEGR